MTYEQSEARGYSGKQLRDWHHGADMGKAIEIAAPFLAVGRTASTEGYTSLENEDERTGYLDNFLREVNLARSKWGNFYALAELLQREEWYWKREGFESFADFWKARTGQTFETLAAMEKVYHYAKLAAPDLFDMDFTEAEEKAHLGLLVESLKSIQPSQPNGVARTPGNRYTSKQEAVADVVRVANYKSPTGNSIERRFSALRRDSPELAERVLAGEDKFFNATDHGCQLNWKAIDEERGGTPRAARDGASKKRDKLGMLESLLRTRDTTLRGAIIATVKSCGWLMKALEAK